MRFFVCFIYINIKCKINFKAKKILEDIIKKYPDYEEAYRLYGLICLDEQDSRKAANFMILASK